MFILLSTVYLNNYNDHELSKFLLPIVRYEMAFSHDHDNHLNKKRLSAISTESPHSGMIKLDKPWPVYLAIATRSLLIYGE